MMTDWLTFILTNFDLMAILCAIFMMFLNRLVTGGRVSEFEITYRWMAVFAVGATGVYAFVMHVCYPEVAANTIGWSVSPFQYEVGMADLSFGLLAIFSFNSSYGFRLAAVMGNTIWLWGDAIGHLQQIYQAHNMSPGNAGSWLYLDLLMPIILGICILKLKPKAL